jgi:hypothetical protein
MAYPLARLSRSGGEWGSPFSCVVPSALSRVILVSGVESFIEGDFIMETSRDRYGMHVREQQIHTFGRHEENASR